MEGRIKALKSIIWTSERVAEVLSRQLPGQAEVVSSRRALVQAAATGRCLLFVEGSRLVEVEAVGTAVPVVAVIEDALPAAIAELDRYPWLSHIVNEAVLTSGLAPTHLEALVHSSTGERNLMRFVGHGVKGRVARLRRASRRIERVERLGEFLEGCGVTPRATALLCDVAEELLTNAFYDAAAAAGHVAKPVSRTSDLALPSERACEITYGVRGEDLAFVRVRDGFGSLARARLVQVLTRCARSDVQIDESMGGAGLGLWRIFSAASFVAVSVNWGCSTTILVGLHRRPRGTSPPPASARPLAIHLFFDGSMGTAIDEADDLMTDQSVTYVRR